MNLDLSYYFAVFLRRIHYFVIITALVSAAAIAAAFLLPSVYQARSLLLLETSQIPGPLQAPTVQIAALEKLQTSENLLMTRANLLDIAKRLNIFRDMDKMTPDDIVQGMRDNTVIKKSAGKGEATTMELSFSAETGKTAAAVVNEYVTMILRADAELRKSVSQGTVELFDQEVKRLSAELSEMSAKILDFQNKNSDALPSTLAFRMTQQSTLQAKIDTLDQQIKQLEDQKVSLTAMFKATGQVSIASGTALTPEAKQLQTLNDQLNQALALLSPENPKIAMLKQQIASLEKIVAAQNQAANPGGATGAPATPFDLQIAALDSQVKTATDQRNQFMEQMKVLQDSIDRTPANQVALDALNRDYMNIQAQYNTAVGRLSQADAAAQIEALSKGEKFTVVDAATVPNNPAKPDRLIISLGGTGAGMVLGMAVILLMEILNRSVRRPKDIVRAFGITPIVTIPYLRTPGETMRRRSAFAAGMMVAVVGIPALIYAVHVFYQPLDVILNQAAAQFGIRL
jgi:polysaccharide chain length determinant protein (PEP-CTERM system associated)